MCSDRNLIRSPTPHFPALCVHFNSVIATDIRYCVLCTSGQEQRQIIWFVVMVFVKLTKMLTCN